MTVSEQKEFLMRLFDSPITDDPKVEAFRAAYRTRLIKTEKKSLEAPTDIVCPFTVEQELNKLCNGTVQPTHEETHGAVSKSEPDDVFEATSADEWFGRNSNEWFGELVKNKHNGVYYHAPARFTK